jgi:hypothetical protein
VSPETVLPRLCRPNKQLSRGVSLQHLQSWTGLGVPASRIAARQSKIDARHPRLSDESFEDVQKEKMPLTVFFEGRAKARRQTGAGTPDGDYLASRRRFAKSRIRASVKEIR